MPRTRSLAAIAAGAALSLAIVGAGLAGAAGSKSGTAMHHAMHHSAAMHEAGAAMHGAPTATASTTG